MTHDAVALMDRTPPRSSTMRLYRAGPLLLVCAVPDSHALEVKLSASPFSLNVRQSSLAWRRNRYGAAAPTTNGKSSSSWSSRAGPRSNRGANSGLRMALTPVGPFCPFRSTAATAMESRMEHLSARTPEIAAEMTRIGLDFSTGQAPDKDRLLMVAEGLETETENWLQLMTRLRLSSDFQTREYCKLSEAHLGRYNSTVESVSGMVRWQAGCLRAIANNSPPPLPPPGVDLTAMAEQMMQQQQQSEDPSGSNSGPLAPQGPSLSAMAMASQITDTPFEETSPAFESPTVRDEYEKLCRDHHRLIELGGGYGAFDPLGKLAYLDEIEKVQDRWDVFFARFQLMGVLNRRYVKQCNEFLASMSLDEGQYRDLLKSSHDLMRREAEQERNQIYSF